MSYDLTRTVTLPDERDTGLALDSKVALAYVGSVVPDQPLFHTPAFSRAGQRAQQGLLLGLERAGLRPAVIISLVPIAGFPRSSRLWVRRDCTQLSATLPVKLVGFLNVTPLKQFVIGLGVLGELLRWGWKVRRKPHRVVYTFNLSVPPGLFTLLGARLIGAKAVVAINDVNVPGQTVPSTLANRLDYWLHKWLIRRFDGHIVVADRIMRDFAPDSPYLRVDGGIRPEVLQRTGAAFKIRPGDSLSFVIAFAGSLDEANGVLVLLEAFSKLKGEHFRLRIAGGGPLTEMVKAAAAKDSRIEYLGYISFEQVLDLYNSADVLINMRLTQSIHTDYFYPSKLLEYFSSGTPVISTCTGHTEEEYGSICYLCKDETPQGLAALLEKVSALPMQERARIGDAARAYVTDNKTWDAQARKVLAFICKAVLRDPSLCEEGSS